MNTFDQVLNTIGALLATYLFIWMGLACMGLLIQGLICWFLQTCIVKIPPEHRQLQPSAAWVLFAVTMLSCVPCIGGIILAIDNFLFWPKLSRSFKAYFDSIGETSEGDCGESLGKVYCYGCVLLILTPVLLFIPFLGMLLWMMSWILAPALLAIWIILLVKVGRCKSMIRDVVDPTPEFPISNP